jgi:dephospho-CoA kinase
VPFVGLTGGMGAGKSTALSALQRLGAAVLSSDAVVHELYERPELRDALVERWGPEVAPQGVVDRAAVAARAFADADERAWLEGKLWPLVGAEMGAWLERVRALPPGEEPAAGGRPRAAIVEVPLLFESGMEGAFDATIAVVTAEELRRERAATRGHALEDERAARQMPQVEKARRATYVVRNDGSPSELERELSAILDKLST